MWALLVVALVASNAVACGSGCYEYNGNCACEQKPAVEPTSYAVPSDEAPPRSGLAAYQDPSVKAAEPKSLIYDDAKADQAKAQADEEGKKAAGVYSIPDPDMTKSTN